MTTAPIGREERTRQVILDAAGPLLARDPEASMAQIADAAGIGRATLYRHYEGREALVRDLAQRAIGEAGAALAAAHLDTVEFDEAVRRAFRALVHVGQRFAVVLREKTGPDRAGDYGEVGRRLTALVERGRKEGVLRDDVPVDWSLRFLGAMLHLAVQLAEEGGPEDAAAFAAGRFLHGAHGP